jgi:hypothetical protein
MSGGNEWRQFFLKTSGGNQLAAFFWKTSGGNQLAAFFGKRVAAISWRQKKNEKKKKRNVKKMDEK